MHTGVKIGIWIQFNNIIYAHSWSVIICGVVFPRIEDPADTIVAPQAAQGGTCLVIIIKLVFEILIPLTSLGNIL